MQKIRYLNRFVFLSLIFCARAGGSRFREERSKGGKPCICDFVHGSDGIGDLFLPEPTINKVEEIAAEFLVNKVSEFHGEVSVLALGPLTNVALAVKRHPSFASRVKKIVALGGAFFAAGNVNPVAKANVC